jgi:hypothetical protein
MIIIIGEKLLSKNLPQIIDEYWNSSFKQELVVFDFSLTRWISNGEVLFLVGWINQLSEKGIIVAIQLPRQGSDLIDSENYKKRQYFQFKILNDWKIKKYLPSAVKIRDGGIPTVSPYFNSINEIFKIPIIDHKPSFDSDFKQLYYNEDIGIYRNYSKLLQETNINYFDSDFLSYSIVKELYSNVCIHSNIGYVGNCYYSVSINKKIPKEKTYGSNLFRG